MFEYRATAINVVDGDTLDVIIDLGLTITIKQRVRLYGIDTPERGHPGADAASVALREYVLPVDPNVMTRLPLPLIIRTVKPHDKYGRWLASIETPTVPDVAARMIELGLGIEYYGGAR
jgi:micrococcal nuclease